MTNFSDEVEDRVRNIRTRTGTRGGHGQGLEWTRTEKLYKKIDRTKTHKEMDKVKDDNSKLKLGITK